jgi:sugar phosphate isomerase/epimerase
MYQPGIHHITAVETDPISFVEIAAEIGCREISVFAQQPSERSVFPLVTRENKLAMRDKLRQTGVRLANIESFMISANTDVAVFRPAMELGAELGARGVVTQIFDTEEPRVIDKLGALCAMAEALGMKVAIEFMALTPAWNTLDRAAGLVERTALPNLAIAIDILHLVRSGGSPADVAILQPRLVAYAQLCDGTDLGVTRDYAAEAIGNRLAPGEGVFPLASFISALPAGTPLEVEVPQPQNRPPLERARHAVTAVRRLIEAASPPAH